MKDISDGVYVALITPFTKNDNIDYDSIEKLINYHNIINTTGIVLLGTTGESPTLNEDEKREIIKFVHSKKNKLNLIIGIGGNNTKQVVEFGKWCDQYADGFMVTVPSYNKPSQEGIYMHFKTIAESTTHPIMMYNIPSRCGVNMNYETVVKLYDEFENIVAIKEASGSLSQIQDIIKNCNIKIFAGDDSQLVPVMSIGGKGVVSVYANINSKSVLDCYQMCVYEKYSEARKLYFNYHDEVKALFVKTNPIPVKEMLADQRMIVNKTCRLPLC
jgi:4-hydroxy-tetrahydrodipicolinate synthase